MAKDKSKIDVDILLVEDNPDDVELAMHAFEQYKLTNRIHVVKDGAEALDFLFGRGAYEERQLDNPPKVILLDLKLPRVDGLEVLKEIKANEHLKQVPVVVLTSSNEERDIVKSYELGVNSFIVKPVDFDQFLEAMRTIGYYWLLLNKNPWR